MATFRPVKVGIAGDEYFEVVDGLREGETIVAGTYQAIRDLKDGARVRRRRHDQARRGAGVMSEVIRIRDLTRDYEMGDGADPGAPRRDASTSAATSTWPSWGRRARASPP